MNYTLPCCRLFDMNSTQLDPNSILALIQRFVGPDPDALDRTRVQLENEIANAKIQLSRAEAQLTAVKELQEVLAKETVPNGQQTVSGMDPALTRPSDLKPTRAPNAPSLRTAILAILEEAPGLLWTKEELLQELDLRRWGPTSGNPRNTLNSRLFELTKAGSVVRQGDTYYIPPKDEEVPAI